LRSRRTRRRRILFDISIRPLAGAKHTFSMAQEKWRAVCRRTRRSGGTHPARIIRAVVEGEEASNQSPRKRAWLRRPCSTIKFNAFYSETLIKIDHARPLNLCAQCMLHCGVRNELNWTGGLCWEAAWRSGGRQMYPCHLQEQPDPVHARTTPSIPDADEAAAGAFARVDH